MPILETIRLNPSLELQRQPIGDDVYCVIIDDFLAEPADLIDFACKNAADFSIPELSYPGLVMNIEDEVLFEFHRFIRMRMSREFGFLRGNAKISTGLSMMTLQPDELSNFQRLCHTDPRDTSGRRNYAALVYLYHDERLGGTAFYRWKKPEVIRAAMAQEAQDPSSAAAFLAEHTAAFREPARYLTESNELAELLQVIPARFNRFVFYSGEIPHSAYITSPELLSEDFAEGRLTLNCFANVVPR